LILNQFLPLEELQNTLPKEKLRDLEFILKVLTTDGKKIHSIFEEDELLGQIHRSLNISKITKKEFRRKLFDVSSPNVPSIWENYFSQFGITKKISEMSDSEFKKNIEKYVEFKWENNEITKKFLEIFDYPDYLIPNKNDIIPEKEIIYGENVKFEPFKMLLGYQASIVEKALKKLENLNSRCLIQMPTGTGKTRTAMEIISNILNQNPNIQIVWFANSSELLEQAHDAFIHIWNHVGKNPITIVNAWGSKQIPKIPDERVLVFAGYAKMNNFLEVNNYLKPHYIVIDEAHRILAPTYKKSLYQLTNFENSTRIIGLTATPGRGIDEIQNKLLVDEFQGQIIQIELNEELKKIYEKNIIKFLEDEEILSKAIYTPLPTKFMIDLSKKDRLGLKKLVEGDRPEFSSEFLERLGNDNDRNLLIIEKLKEYAENGKKILFFATNVSQSMLIFTVLQKLGIKALHVDGNSDRSFRRQIIKKFKDTNEINIICNYDIFSTGFDVPDLDVVFIGRPVNSPVLLSQIIGRGTRGPKMGSKKNSFELVQVTDIIETNDGNFNPYEQYVYWDKNWKDQS
jgi:DNA repair protein RadD